jgi:membrane-associated phospholipid phosphatase
VSADPKQAASEILAGTLSEAARRWLGPTIIFVSVLFLIDTYLVVNQALLNSFDLPITIFVQQFNWGPLVYVMDLINWSAGYKQVVLGAAAIIALFVYERRAGWLMLIGSVSCLLDKLIKLAIARQRPPSDLVHILSPATGFSYPSGHAVFFTWMAFMIAVSLAPRTNPRLRPILWIAATLAIVLTCLARVWAGDHWPSDIIGGVLVGIGWSAFVMWLPERWLPSPSWTWLRGRPRRTA